MYTLLRHRTTCDRLGTHLLCYVSQIIICMIKEIYIFLPEGNVNHSNSIFAKSLFYFMDLHNKKLMAKHIPMGERTEIGQIHDMNWIMGHVVQLCGKSIPEYFRQHIWPEISDEFYNLARTSNYPHSNFLENIRWNENIVCHLRLDDIVGRGDYRMWICVNHYRKLLEEGKETPIKDFFDDYLQRHNCQRELPDNIIEEQISRGQIIGSTDKVTLVMSPKSRTTLPYSSIANTDESLDLYMMCMSQYFIGSRSTYSICAILWGEEKKWCSFPRWGHLTCTGIGTKFCKLKNLEEFY